MVDHLPRPIAEVFKKTSRNMWPQTRPGRWRFKNTAGSFHRAVLSFYEKCTDSAAMTSASECHLNSVTCCVCSKIAVQIFAVDLYCTCRSFVRKSPKKVRYDEDKHARVLQ